MKSNNETEIAARMLAAKAGLEKGQRFVRENLRRARELGSTNSIKALKRLEDFQGLCGRNRDVRMDVARISSLMGARPVKRFNPGALSAALTRGGKR